MLTITTNARAVNGKVRSLGKSLGRTTIRRAMNNALKSTRNEAAKMANAELALAVPSPSTWIKNQIKKVEASDNRLSGQIRVRQYKTGMAKFRGYKQTKEGVRARFWKKQPFQTIKSGFDFKSQKKLAMIRTTSKRLPIRRLWGPGIYDSLNPDRSDIAKFMGKRFQVEQRRAIRAALARAGAYD